MNTQKITKAAALVTLISGAANASVTFHDGTFAPSSWSSTVVTDANGGGSSINQYQSLAGGNTNEYMRVEITLVASAPGGSVLSLNKHNSAFYDPSNQGLITSIHYSEDSKNFMPGVAGNIQGTGLLIEQGGKTFIQRNPVLVMPSPGFSDWATNSAPGLIASDLWEITNAGVLIASSNPDFSATGGQMQFGFWRGASSGNFVGTDFRDAGIDNWHVEIIPTPGSASLLLTAGLIGAKRRRR